MATGRFALTKGRVFVVGATLCWFVFALTAIAVWLDYERTVQNTERQARATINLAADSFEQFLRDIDHAVVLDAEHIAALAAAGEDLRDKVDKQGFRDFLIQQAATLPLVAAISVVDHQGQWVVSSRMAIPPERAGNTSVSLAYFREHDDARTVLLGPITTPTMPQPRVLLAHRVLDQNGQLAAIVGAVVIVREIEALFESATAQDRQIVMTHPDGAELLHFPGGAARWSPAALTGWRRVVEQGGGSFVTADANGARQLIYVRVSANWPVVITTSMPMAQVLSNWRSVSLMVGLLIGLAASAILLLTRLLGRSVQDVQQHVAEIAYGHEALRRSLSYDQLTGLANRSFFVATVERTLERTAYVSVLSLSLNGLSAIVDTRGHTVGDELLIAVGKRLVAAVNSGDLPARVGEDEFMVLLPDLSVYADVEAFATRLVGLLAGVYWVGGEPLTLNCSVGVAFGPEDGHKADQLLRNATTAMHRAKEHGNECRRFLPTIDRRRQERLAIEQDLRAAIGSDQFWMEFQPICQLSDGKIRGFEALVRWKHPVRGLVSPAHFIPIAETSGLILPLDRWIMSTSLNAAHGWADRFSISINLSPSEFHDIDLPARVHDLLSRTGVTPRRLVLEITETTLLEAEDHVGHIMRELKAVGIRLALDDFGTGHAGLSYLHRFPFDRVKIDQSFVRELGHNDTAEAIVEATLALCNRLGLEVTAEGVETAEQLAFLQACSCHLGQGFLIGRPMQEQDVVAFVNTYRGITPAHQNPVGGDVAPSGPIPTLAHGY